MTSNQKSTSQSLNSSTNQPINSPINYSTFPYFSSAAIAHGIFARNSGVSSAPFDSLNISYGVGDSSENVQVNRQLIKTTLNLSSLLSSRQVHGNKVAIIKKPPLGDQELDGFDALITNVPGLGLMTQQADCQAVMLYDPVKRVVGNVHSGWRGSALNIIKKTIMQMADEFGSIPNDISAVISPSLGPCCAEFVHFKTELPEEFFAYQVKPNYFDFWAISCNQLRQAGVMDKHMHVDGTCTVCNHDYFSYRRDGKTGRGASVIGLL